MKLKFLLVSLALISCTCVAQGTVDSHDHESIVAAIDRFLTSNIRQSEGDFEVKIARFDRRLRLARCNAKLEPFFPHDNKRIGKVTVGVRCPGAKPWKIYTTASIRTFQKVAIAIRPLARGAVVSREDFRFERKDISKLRQGFLTSDEQILNKQTKRALSRGAVFSAANLRSQQLIKRGQRVTIRAQSPTFDIRMSGLALMDGEAGQQIRVRNDKSKRIVEGKVIAPGIVQVAL